MTREENDERIRVLREKLDNCPPDEREGIDKELSDALKTEQEWIKSETQERVSKKDRVVKWVVGLISGIGTIGLTLFKIFYHGYRDDKTMYFEEHGTVRSYAWKTKDENIEKVNVDVR